MAATPSGGVGGGDSVVAAVVRVVASTPRWQLVEHGLAALVLWRAASFVRERGLKKSVGAIVRWLLGAVPGAATALDTTLDAEVRNAVADMMKDAPAAFDLGVPAKGVPKEDIMRELDALKSSDVKPADGLTFAYVYTPFEKSVHDVAHRSASMFCDLNALNPTAFPSLRKMEVEVVAMCRHMTGAVDGVVGSMTSGGTESILMAVKTARDHARATRGIVDPECVLPSTAHPAFAKAGHYLGVKMVWVPSDPATGEADVPAMAAAVNANTVLLVGSAPQYPHGVLDPIAGIAEVARSRGCLMHVDACFGGFVLPWLRAAGFEHPDWDFRVPGVTSISMDVHKYGFSVKGASCVLYRSRDLRVRQYFSYSEWPGGLFVSPSMLGTRAGGPIASAWATMRHLGVDGYVSTVRRMMETALFFRDAVGKLDGVEIVGDPVATAVAIRSSDSSMDIYAVADVMEASGGWKLERNKDPACLHLTVMPPHSQTRDKFVADMRDAIAKVRADPDKFSKAGSAAMYGMIARIPDETIIDTFVAKWMDQVYSPQA